MLMLRDARRRFSPPDAAVIDIDYYIASRFAIAIF